MWQTKRRITTEILGVRKINSHSLNILPKIFTYYVIFPLRELLKDMPEFYVPEVIEDLTSKQVLTTELIDGTSLDKIENVDQDTINKVLLVCEQI